MSCIDSVIETKIHLLPRVPLRERLAAQMQEAQSAWSCQLPVPLGSVSATESRLSIGHVLYRAACIWWLRGRHQGPAISAQLRTFVGKTLSRAPAMLAEALSCLSLSSPSRVAQSYPHGCWSLINSLFPKLQLRFQRTNVQQMASKLCRKISSNL